MPVLLFSSLVIKVYLVAPKYNSISPVSITTLVLLSLEIITFLITESICRYKSLAPASLVYEVIIFSMAASVNFTFFIL